MTFYRMNKTPKTSNERDALVTPAKSRLVNRNILIDEELVKFFPRLEKSLTIVPFKGRLLGGRMLKES